MEVLRSAPQRRRTLAVRLLGAAVCAALALLAMPSLVAATTVTDLGEGFPVSINASDHVLIGRLTFDGEGGGDAAEEELDGPWSIWAGGKSTSLLPLNGEGEEEGSIRHELTLEEINDAGEAAGTSTVNVPTESGERSEDRPVVYSPSGVGREVALFQDTFTNEEGETNPIGGLGFGVDNAGDVVGVGAVEIGGKLYGRGFLAPGGSSPVVVGAADAPAGRWVSEIFEVNASGTMVGLLAGLDEEGESTGNKYFLWKTPSSAGTRLNFDFPVRGLANDDTVLGERGGTVFMRTPDGKEVAVTGLAKPEAVNSSHQIVGLETVKGAEHAAVWQGGHVTDLNALLPEHSGWVLQRAVTINDAGDIAGVGVHEGHASAFLLSAPVKEELEVDSVEDTTTGLNSGSILGGDILKIKGSGFELPEEGEAEVQFFFGGKVIASAEVTPSSDSEIEVVAPDLSSSRDQVPDGADGLATDVRVQISSDEEGEHHTEISPSALDGTGADAYDALVPAVASVTDEATNDNKGSILGGDTLKIKGSGFGAPKGGKTTVVFSLGEEQLEKVEVTPASAKEITLPAPDLARFQSKAALDKQALPLDVAVITSGGGKEVRSKKVPGDAFEALLPKVDSVTDKDTDLPFGSILGGETLQIKGSGFNVPVGGSAAVRFYLNGSVVKTVQIEEDEGEGGSGSVSPDEIRLTAPDLASLKGQIAEGDDALVLDVVVAIKDAAGDEVVSPSNLDGKGDDAFAATIPFIQSVTDETTKTNSGSILGGDTLKIKGLAFNAPDGAKVMVKFNLGTDTVKTVEAKPDETGECEEGCEEITPTQSPTELTVETPNLANLAKSIPEGKEGLPLNVTVAIVTKTEEVESKSSFDGEGDDAFEALLPKVSSVADKETGEPVGSILGGETLVIKGSGFNVPVGGSASVRFYLGGDRVKTVEVEENPEGEGGNGFATPDEIQIPAPDLASLQDQIHEGSAGLPLDVVVAIKDAGGNEVVSPSNLTGEGEDMFIAAIPVVFSVTDETTKANNGSILGGDILKIKGVAFNAPPGATVAVKFNLGEDTVKTVPVNTELGECEEGCEEAAPAQSSTELTVETPDLASLAASIPDAKEGLPLNVTVEIKTKTDDVESKGTFDGKGDDAFEALLPKVSSVEDPETGLASGSIVGGETLAIKGSGFNVPEGGSAQVKFVLGGDVVKTVEVVEDLEGGGNGTISPTEIRLPAPNLSSLQGQIPEGQSKLVIDIRVVILDGDGAEVASRLSDADKFSFYTLGITSAGETTFKVGDAGSFAVTTQGTEPITLKASGALPQGVGFVETEPGAGELAGTPAPGTAGVYHLTITASNGVDPDAKQSFTLTVQDVPGAPASVTAVAGVQSAKVSWSPPTSDGESEIETYVVTASPGGESVTVGPETSSTVIEDLSAGTAYTFSVAAENAIGVGAATTSNTVVVTSAPIEEEQSATSESPEGSASTDPVSSSEGATLTATGEGEGTVKVGTYAENPVARLSDGSSFFDVSTTADSNFTSVSFEICGVAANASIQWWDPAAHAWRAVSDQTAPAGEPPCVTVTVDSSTSPSLSQLSGTVFAVTTPSPSPTEEAPATGEPSKAPAGPTTDTGSTATATGTGAQVSGVSGFAGKTGPQISPAGAPKVRGSAVLIPLHCGAGSGTCAAVSLRLTVEEHIHGRHLGAITAKDTVRTVVVGKLEVTLTAGQSKVVVLPMNRTGKRLLKVHGRFKASLLVRAANATLERHTVTITRPRKD